MKARARARHTPGTMNKLEGRFAEYLEGLKRDGTLLDYGFERLRLKLAKLTTYTPDFDAITCDLEVVIYEVKGYWEEDSRIKVKCAAKEFWQFHFVGVTWDAKQKEWKFEKFGE